ncbi:MAG: hypothetical protein HY696_12455 [Deltaproteobacteria bacterium]|nr:hypothetical protein [Deltaproteobacteria bacterium]
MGDELRCYPGPAVRSKGFDPQTIRVAVVANEDASLPTGMTIAEGVRQASRQLRQLTGKQFRLTELCYGRFGQYSTQHPPEKNPDAQQIMTTYLTKTAADTPDYVVVLVTDEMTSSFGGYRLGAFGATPAEQEFLRTRDPAFCQRVSTDVYYGNRPVVYGAAIQAIHPFGGCGYITGFDGEHSPLRKTSSDGACRGQDGLTCVWRKSDQTSHCPGDEKHPQSTIAGMMRFSIAHELGHYFGDEGNDDHFGSPQCVDRVGTERLAGKMDGNAGMCVDVWDRLRAAEPACLEPEPVPSVEP